MSSLEEAIIKQRALVEFIDKVMLPDAKLVCAGNKASSIKLKKGTRSQQLLTVTFF